MMGHNLCFYGEIRIIILKLSLLPLLICSTAMIILWLLLFLLYVNGKQLLWSCCDGQLT